MRLALVAHLPGLGWRLASTGEPIYYAGRTWRGGGLMEASFGESKAELRLRMPEMTFERAADDLPRQRVDLRLIRQVGSNGRWVRAPKFFPGIVQAVRWSSGEAVCALGHREAQEEFPAPARWSQAAQQTVDPGDRFFEHATGFGERVHERGRWPFYWGVVGGVVYPIDPVTPNKIVSNLPPRVLLKGEGGEFDVAAWGINLAQYSAQHRTSSSDNGAIIRLSGLQLVAPVIPGGQQAGTTNVRVEVEGRDAIVEYVSRITVLDGTFADVTVEIGVPHYLAFGSQDDAAEAAIHSDQDQSVGRFLGPQPRRPGASDFGNRFVGEKLGQVVITPSDGGTFRRVMVVPTTEANLPPDFSKVPAQPVNRRYLLDLSEYIDPSNSESVTLARQRVAEPRRVSVIARQGTANANQFWVNPLSVGEGGRVFEARRTGVYLTSQQTVAFIVPQGFTVHAFSLPPLLFFSRGRPGSFAWPYAGGPGETVAFSATATTNAGTYGYQLAGVADDFGEGPSGRDDDIPVVVTGNTMRAVPLWGQDQFGTWRAEANTIGFAPVSPAVAGVTTIRFTDTRGAVWDQRVRYIAGTQPPVQRTIIIRGVGNTHTLTDMLDSSDRRRAWAVLDSDIVTLDVPAAFGADRRRTITITAVRLGETLITARFPGAPARDYFIRVFPA